MKCENINYVEKNEIYVAHGFTNQCYYSFKVIKIKRVP